MTLEGRIQPEKKGGRRNTTGATTGRATGGQRRAPTSSEPPRDSTDAGIPAARSELHQSARTGEPGAPVVRAPLLGRQRAVLRGASRSALSPVAACPGARGRSTRKEQPSPGALRTESCPRWASHDRLGDGESGPHAPRVAGPGTVGAIEAVEDMCVLLRGKAGAAVPHKEASMATVPAQAHGHRRARRL